MDNLRADIYHSDKIQMSHDTYNEDCISQMDTIYVNSLKDLGVYLETCDDIPNELLDKVNEDGQVTFYINRTIAVRLSNESIVESINKLSKHYDK